MNKYKTLSIIIPAYNEERYIETTLNKVVKANTVKLKKEIIVVNDGSTDNTAEILKKYRRKHNSVRVFNKKKNEGKGSAVKMGLMKSTGDILVIQDADFEYNPYEIVNLIQPILDNKTEVVYGSRHLKKGNPYSSPAYYLGGRLIDEVISKTLGVNLSDAITGSKAFTRGVYRKIAPIESNGFEIEAELTVKIVKAGYAPYEVPISYQPRSHQEGKNIRWHHGLAIIKALFKYSFIS